MISADTPRARLATRLAFLAGGFSMAAWAPLVPLARQRLGVDEGVLGLLLLCLGVGSVSAMGATGILSARYGPRPVIGISGLTLAAALPFLAITTTPVALGIALFVFGAGLGSLDVAMNIHAIEVEKAAAHPLMSGFHALFSIGGFTGAATVTALLFLGAPAAMAAICAALIVGVVIAMAWPGLLVLKTSRDGPLIAFPKGIVLVLALLAAVTFLTEGAILDWSALLLTGQGLFPLSQGGIGYIAFSIAMTGGRLFGDALTARLGDFRTLLSGGLVALAGFAALLIAPHPGMAIVGFVLIGLGASNIVPVLFRLAGSQTAMPSALGIAAVTTTGYAGVLLGPAAVGAAAKLVGLPAAFWGLAALLALVPLTAHHVTRNAAS